MYFFYCKINIWYQILYNEKYKADICMNLYIKS